MALLSDRELASLWDGVSKRRVEVQRVSAANTPATDLRKDCVEIIGAWAWLPTGCLSGPQSWPVLASTQAKIDRTPRLKERLGQGRCPIDEAGPFKPRHSALDRALQLLTLTLGAWSLFASTVRWAETRLVLFPPEGVTQDAWLDTVARVWPDAMPAHSIVVTPLSVEDWFDHCLSASSGVKRLVLLNVNSRLATRDCSGDNSACASGECVSAIHLQRVESGGSDVAGEWRLYPAKKAEHGARQLQSRSDTQDLTRIMQGLREMAASAVDQVSGVVTDGATSNNRFTQLMAFVRAEFEACETVDHIVSVAALAGDVGHSATVLAQLSVAYLLAVQSTEGAVLVADRYRPNMTAGWLLVK